MSFTEFMKKFKNSPWNKVVKYGLVPCASLCVVIATVYALILPGIAKSGDTYCGLKEHEHDDDCYTVEKVLVCDLEEGDEHTHTDECYEEEKVLTCTKEEHTHTEECYSDPSADVESKSDWKESFSNADLDGDWSEDVIAIAKTQLGYKESKKNYIVKNSGTKRGYTRYGDWYGDEYGKWSAMFAAFCINYADIPTSKSSAAIADDGSKIYMPISSDPQEWIEKLNRKSTPYYYAVNDDHSYKLVNGKNSVCWEKESKEKDECDLYHPQVGDLIFLNTDDDKAADHVGLISKITYRNNGEIKKISVIEGDSDNRVEVNKYKADSSKIMGFGKMPANPENEPETEEEKKKETVEEKETETENAAEEVKETAVNSSDDDEDAEEAAVDSDDENAEAAEEISVDSDETEEAFADSADKTEDAEDISEDEADVEEDNQAAETDEADTEEDNSAAEADEADAAEGISDIEETSEDAAEGISDIEETSEDTEVVSETSEDAEVVSETSEDTSEVSDDDEIDEYAELSETDEYAQDDIEDVSETNEALSVDPEDDNISETVEAAETFVEYEETEDIYDTDEDEVRLINHSVQAVIYEDSYYEEIADDQTVVSVSGDLPENAYVYAYPAYFDKSDFEDGISVLRAYDITIYDSQGNVFEPAEGNTISVNIDIPGLEEMADPDTVSVYYLPVDGDPEEMQSQAEESTVSFDAGHFSTYVITANDSEQTIDVDGVTYKKLVYNKNILTVTTANTDGIVRMNKDTFTYTLKNFTIDNTQENDKYYVQLPQYAVLEEVTENTPIYDKSGNVLAYYQIINDDDNDISYILITAAVASNQLTGSISASGTCTKEGTINFPNGTKFLVIDSDTDYNKLSIEKSNTSQTKNADGSYTFNFTMKIKNDGDTAITDLWFMDNARNVFNANGKNISVTYTVPVSSDAGAPEFKEVTDTSDKTLYPDNYNYYSIGDPENPVTIPANTTYTYTSTATITAEDFALLENASAAYSCSNGLSALFETTKLRTATSWYNYYPRSLVLSKKALTADITDDSDSIPWEISFNTNSRLNTKTPVLSDTIKENYYEQNNIHFLTGSDYPATATITYFNKVQTTIQLKWQEVDDLDNIENPDGETIYYKENSFRYFPYEYSGWSQNYGVILKYYTNYDKEISPTANEAQANFVDVNGVTGTIGEVGVSAEGTFDTRVQLNKMLDAQNDNNTADWTSVSSINTTSDLICNYIDTMPSTANQGSSTYDKLVNDKKIYANSVTSEANLNSAYILFDSVADFEEVTGIKITVTDRLTGAVLDKEKILCGGAVSYTNEYSHTYDETDLKKLLFCYDTKATSGSHCCSFMIVPNVPESVAQTTINTAVTNSKTNYDDVRGFLPSNEAAGTQGGYNITFSYTTDTSGASKGETRRNYMTHNGKVLDTKDAFSLEAQAYYIKSSDESVSSIEKHLAEMTLQDDGSYRMTYVVLLDNRGNCSTAINNLYWDDVVSGIEGADYDPGSLDVYMANVSYDEDNKEWDIERYSSLSDIENAAESGSLLQLISNETYTEYFASGAACDITDLITFSDDAVDKGIRFGMNLRKFLKGANSTYSKLNNRLMRNWSKDNKNFCWQSFYLVYDVIVPESGVSSGTLRNTVTRYVDGNIDTSTYNEFDMGMKELQKKELQKANSANGYWAKYELDVSVTDKLAENDTFTIQDNMSDNLNFDVSSLDVSCIKDETESSVTSGFKVHYANGSLTLTFDKPADGWPSSYKITYKAKVTGDGAVTYSNEASIPIVGGSYQKTESSTYVIDSSIKDRQVTIEIQKYDGDDVTKGLDGAKFTLKRLTNDAQKTLAEKNITSKSAMETYLNDLYENSPESWTDANVPQPQAVAGSAGKFSLTSTATEAIYSNVVYRLTETTTPTGYVEEDVHRYFMIYSETADATYTGITAGQAYSNIYPYVDQEYYSISYQIPNYMANFSFYKVNRKDKDLTGAEFTLYRSYSQLSGCSDVVERAIPTKDKDGRECYNMAELTEGTYYLKETKAPDGYSLNSEVVKVEVAADGTISFDSVISETDPSYSKSVTSVYLNTDGDLTIVDDTSTYTLPKTGGSGTLPYTAAGCILMLGAFTGLLLKRRKSVR